MKNIALTDTSTNLNYQHYTENVAFARKFLEEKFSKAFRFFELESQEWNMFIDDYRHQAEELEFIGRVSENINDKQIVWNDEETEYRIEESPVNAIYYYPAYEVAIVNVWRFKNHDQETADFVFYADEAKCRAFLDEAKERGKTVDNKEIIMLIDGPNGTTSSRKKVNELIDRDQVVLEEKVKQDIYSSIDQFFEENNEFYQKYNIPHKRGILLYGEPGNGKTTLVKSLVGSIDAPVVYWQISEFTSSENIQDVFRKAHKLSPAVLVVEDLDALPPHTRSTFLNTLDGATTKEGIFLIGTTNYPERIDKALINRVGRFDRTYEIKLPNEQLRFDYLVMRGTKDFVTEEEIRKIAKATEDLSFVQLSEVFRQLAHGHFYKQPVDVFEVIDVLKDNNKKTKKNAWNTKNDKILGFSE